MNVPVIVRAMRASCAGVKSWTPVTVKLGAVPWMTPSFRLRSPSCANASSRIFNRRAVSDLSLATVKSHVRYTLERLTFALRSALRSALEVVRHSPRGARRFRLRRTTT